MSAFTIVWLVLLAAVVAVEVVAIVNAREGDTLSEHTWRLVASWWGRLVVLPSWCWATWHLFVERYGLPDARSMWLDDLGVIGFAAAAIAYVTWPDRRP